MDSERCRVQYQGGSSFCARIVENVLVGSADWLIILHDGDAEAAENGAFIQPNVAQKGRECC